MRKFVAKFEFSATDLEADAVYFKMLEAVEDAFPDVNFDSFFRSVIIPDAEISAEDFQSEDDFDKWTNTLRHSG